MLGTCFVLQYFVSFQFCNELAGAQRELITLLLLRSECDVTVIVL